MRHAKLTGANLERAQQEGALLRQANLYQSNLAQASLSGADLTGAQLDKADLLRTTLHGANLASVSGLTQPQLDIASVDEQTTLPAELNRPHPCKTSKAKR